MKETRKFLFVVIGSILVAGCDDEEKSSIPEENTAAACADGVDNDGATDCSDAECSIFCSDVGSDADTDAGEDDPSVDLQDFDMEQVRVTDSYYQNLFEKDLGYLMRLDPNRLMAAFEAVSNGSDPETAGVGLYGGWEGGWSLLRGHTLGHYLSALAMAYKQTRGVNQALHEQIASRISYMINQLRLFQERSTNGFLFGSFESHFDVVEGTADGDMWVPWYTMHKLIAGFVDVHKLTGNETALDIASTLGDWTYNRASSWDSDLRDTVLGVEYGGMNDGLYELYKYTNDPNHLTAAHIFDEDSLFTQISQGQDILSGLHANTQIPKFIGALNRYRTLGDEEQFYYTAAEQFWHIVTENHTYVTGGNSELEHFRTPGHLNAYRDNTNNETCNSHNMMKLTRELFKITRDVKYADFYERTYINEILSAINPETGMTTYFKPMGTGYFKLFGTEINSFWCCTGTGMENYVKLNDSVYFHGTHDLYVNMYVSSTLDWTERGLSLSVDANLPQSDTVTFTIDAAPATGVKIKFRKPYWVTPSDGVAVAVNGASFDAQEVDGYLEVSRVWQAGDTVALAFSMEAQVSRLPDAPNVVAFTYGPIVLSAGLGTEQMVSEPQWASKKAIMPDGVYIKDFISINSGDIEGWIGSITENLVRAPGALEFTLLGTDSDDTLVFTPHYQRYTDRYGIYFRLE